MNIRRYILTAALTLLSLCALAQTTSQDYQRRFSNLVSRLGYEGVGLETLLDSWEKDLPEDPYLWQARFLWCFNRAQTVSYIQLDADRHLGKDPILPFTDSLGNRSNFFEDVQFDPDLFAVAEQAIVKAIQLEPGNLDLRLAKIGSLILYERESPDMAAAELGGLIDYNFISGPKWDYAGSTVSEDDFLALCQEYLFRFYRLGTPAATEAFRSLSEKILKYRPGNPLFMNNIGSYYLVFKKDPKTALKYYNKVLKAHPDDFTAIQNCILLARSEKNVKLEKKYLAMMVKHGPDEAEREKAARRLEALNKK